MTPYWFCIGLIALTSCVTGWTGTTTATPAPLPVLALSTNDRILVMAPHPDDESLCCGGIIQDATARHIPIRVVFFTYGDNNQWSFVIYRKHPVFEPRAVQDMGLVRRGEAIQATHLLGLDESQLTFLGYPDFGTLHIWDTCWGSNAPYKSMLTKATAVPYPNAFRPGALYKGEDIMQDLTAILRNFKPTKIFLPHPADHNPDHRALYLFMRVVLWNIEADLKPELFPYLVHFHRWPHPQGLHIEKTVEPPDIMRNAVAWSSFALSSKQVGVKLAALKAHTTQFEYAGKYLSSFARQNELFGDFPAINLQTRHYFHRTSPATVETATDVPEELTAEERDAYTGVQWNMAHLEGNFLALSIELSRPLTKTVQVSFNIFGYRPDRPFREMPKLHIVLGELTHEITDRLQRLDSNTITVIRRNKFIGLRVPLAVLDHPDRILTSARTSMAEVPFDWVAWRILVLPTSPDARNP